MGILYDSLISAAMKRYGVPEWLKPYIYKYAKGSDLETIKRAINFINVRRKKGQITGKQVTLPNGVVFDIKAVIHILNQFHYGTEREAEIATAWSKEQTDYDHANFTKHFRNVAETREKHSRALKNLVEGLGYKTGGPTKEITKVFDTLAGLDEWPDRLIATEVIIKDSYSKPFGFIFYKVFYPVSPEFMRSLGKAFVPKDVQEDWAIGEIKRVIGIGALTQEHVLDLAERMLALIYRSLEAERILAKKAGIEREALLLRDISVAYPLHSLQELGIGLDVDKEMKRIGTLAKRIK